MDKEQVKQIIAEVANESFNSGWNAAVIAISQSIEKMNAFGDTAASFAAYVREFKHDE
jgi:hypothetical protein